MAAGIWDRLPPEEFKQLQEYTKYTRRRLKDVLTEFREGLHKEYDSEQPMCYEGFKLFMSSYLGETISEELCQTLFWTFHKKVPYKGTTEQLPETLLKKFNSEDNLLKQNGQHPTNGAGQIFSRIAKGTRRVTLVARATVVAGITPSVNDSVAPNAAESGVHQNGGNAGQGNLEENNEGCYTPLIEIKEIACYLSLLEGGNVQDKLEFVFSVYDSDNNNYLDQGELELIVAQMVRVAEYLGWDTAALKPILTDMLADMDCDADSQISMEEWIKGGMNNIPFLVLLGMDVKVDEEGKHQWKMKQFKSQAFCNICHSALTGFHRKQGLNCIFCHFTCHERCVKRAPNSCIQTYTESRSKMKATSMDHHWVEGNCNGKCTKCNKTIKMNCLTGLQCVWCQAQVHNRCVANMQVECSLGKHRVHILPPICITPQTHDKKSESSGGGARRKKNSVISYDGIQMMISPLPNTRPLVVFVNPKSGGRQGARLLNKFRYLLNPRQVFNLAEGGPLPGLKFFSQVPKFRVLCCGGDGTAGWLLSCIDRLSSIKERPPMAILPLGTGNDLARCLGWGAGYDGGSIEKYLIKTSTSKELIMDRWQIDCEETDRNEECDTMPQNIMNNYFSIGVDASVALKFHLQREKNPEKFNSRFKNKLRYFEAGTSEQLTGSCKGLHHDVELICDGKNVELPSLEGIAILNIPSIYGGANIWGEVEKKGKKNSQDLSCAVQDLGDRKMEVVGLENSLYVGQIIAGVRQHGLRIAQCSTIVIRLKRTIPMQIDGEPWLQAPCSITIKHKNQTPMCVPLSHNKKGLLKLFSKNKKQ